MTEEYASIKQIEFMKKLGFPPQSADLTKAEARVMIDEKLRENERAPEPEHKHPPAQAKPTNGKEYHLSPEEVKCRALESAIEWGKYKDAITSEKTNLFELADKFVEWIYGK